MHSNDTARSCARCGTPFHPEPSKLRRGHGRYCSLACSNASKVIPLEARFNARVRRSDTCWTWTGRTNPKGYGLLDRGNASRRGDRPLLAHRVSWELTNGPIPDDLAVLHHCDNPPCVRPEHLFLGTRADNNEDMRLKERQQRGERHHNARLTEAAVREAHALWASGSLTQRQIADRLGVSYPTLSEALSGRSWKHLLPPDFVRVDGRKR